jgi:hypothetical protein
MTVALIHSISHFDSPAKYTVVSLNISFSLHTDPFRCQLTRVPASGFDKAPKRILIVYCLLPSPTTEHRGINPVVP